ncbi:uncharacterized protein LOC126906636 [Daktulosphaira vitifoliae]|uniref:uncharacterized protein LOC126906636 n=1 Tax=Daktulosphaira vitifoliae TaxID=58002 RepID=UPI0021AA545F|nr:uncharacterized protein LOC126906636 [Daktulosphaira vitifoliae]
MLLLKLIHLCILLFFVIYTKGDWCNKEKVDKLRKLLQCSGWKNLNDINFIQYYGKKYYPHNLLETQTNGNNCEQKTRGLTVFLGCTYIKVLKNLFTSVISNILQNCQENDNLNGIIWTEELINIISILIVPMATLMKGAIEALDNIHNYPLTILNKFFMISPLLEKIENILDELKEQNISRDDLTTYYSILQMVRLCSKNIIIVLQVQIKSYCEFVPCDTNDLWDEWSQEYEAFIDQDEKLLFIKFLTKKIKNYIKTVIKENYFQLGFKFDPITEETFIPTPTEPIDPELEFKETFEYL